MERGSEGADAGSSRDPCPGGLRCGRARVSTGPIAHRFPAQLEDARDAIRWTRLHAASLYVDPERIGAFGYSAGAHLAALVATRPAENARIQAVAVGGVPADLAALPPNGKTTGLLGGSARELPGRYTDASPLFHVSADDPPFFIYHARFDWIVDVEQGRELRRALRQREVPTEYRETRVGHLAAFVLRQGGAAEAVHFFAHWLRDPVALAQTRARARLETAADRRSKPSDTRLRGS
jgi:acetyl esterase/lipase